MSSNNVVISPTRLLCCLNDRISLASLPSRDLLELHSDWLLFLELVYRRHCFGKRVADEWVMICHVTLQGQQSHKADKIKFIVFLFLRILSVFPSFLRIDA